MAPIRPCRCLRSNRHPASWCSSATSCRWSAGCLSSTPAPLFGGCVLAAGRSSPPTGRPGCMSTLAAALTLPLSSTPCSSVAWKGRTPASGRARSVVLRCSGLGSSRSVTLSTVESRCFLSLLSTYHRRPRMALRSAGETGVRRSSWSQLVHGCS